MAKYEVQKGRTVLTRMGTAHEGAILTLANFSGDDDVKKQEKIDVMVKLGALKEIPLTEAESQALAEAEEKRAAAREKVEKRRLEAVAEAEAKAKKQAEAKEAAEKADAKAREEAEATALAEKEAAEKDEAEAKAAWEKAIIESDFDEMNKDPMIAFAKEYDIELKGSLVDDIRAELKELQESLTAPK